MSNRVMTSSDVARMLDAYIESRGMVSVITLDAKKYRLLRDGPHTRTIGGNIYYKNVLITSNGK